jgi:hypothetical protein
MLRTQISSHVILLILWFRFSLVLWALNSFTGNETLQFRVNTWNKIIRTIFQTKDNLNTAETLRERYALLDSLEAGVALTWCSAAISVAVFLPANISYVLI